MTQIISVSIDVKQAEWLQLHKKEKDCSPSFLLRKACHQKMQEMGEEYQDDIVAMRVKVQKFSERFQKTLKFCEKKGLSDELLAEI